MRSGRHRYSNRRRRGSRWLLGAGVVAALAAGAVAAAMFAPSWFDPRTIVPTVTPNPDAPSCPSARLAGGTPLGSVAWVDSGVVRLLDLDSCDERTLVLEGAAPPIRFSHDGRWIAFGDGSVVPAAGGEVAPAPAGPLSAWQWSPTEDVLAGVTAEGGVVVAGPEEEPRVLLPGGSNAGHVAFSPDGRSLGVDLGGDRVVVVDVVDGASTTIYRVSPGTAAPPQVTGWSPDGRWVLFFSTFADRASVPLNAAPAAGGDWVNVFDPVLPYDDFLSWCGRRLALTGGGEDTPSFGNQILVSGPPDWRYHNISEDFSRSWFWPACSFDGRWIVATVTPSRAETPPGHGIRPLWLLSADGLDRTRLTGSGNVAFEVPRWSSDGDFILVVRRDVDPTSPGALLLLRIDPASGKTTRAAAPLARMGAAPGEDGHTDWSNVTDWYRP